MNLKCETILDFYTHKKKKIFCQIRVQPSRSHKTKYTCRSLTLEQWNTFDKELGKFLDCMMSSEDGDSELLGKFMIGPKIEVKVQKSKLSLKYLCKCLATSGDNEKDIWGNIEEIKDIAFVLECLLVLEQESILNSSEETQEYEPQIETSPDGKLTTALTYEPYTPSKRKHCADSIDTTNTSSTQLLNYNEDTYSPMPLFETSTADSLNKNIPQYKPAPIKEIGNPKNSINENKTDVKDDIFELKSKEEYIPEGRKTTTFDIPAYVPTPIDWSPTRKALKSFYENHNDNFRNKCLRRRSKTMDAIPKDLASSIFCKQKSEDFVTQSDEGVNDKITKFGANEVIYGTDDETVSTQKSRSLKLKTKKRREKETDNNLKSEELNEDIESDELTVGINYLPETLPDSYNKKCRRRCTTLDSRPRELAIDVDKVKLNIIFKENKTKKADIESHKLKEKKNELNEINTDTNGKDRKLDKNHTKVAPLASLTEEGNIPEQLKKLKKQKETDLNENDTEFEDERNVDKNNLNTSTSSATDTSSPKIMRNNKKTKELYSSITSARRSNRSPSKPIRLIEEIGVDTNSDRQKKRKKLKPSPKNKELFGTDDDEDDDDYFENNGDSNYNANKIKTASVFESPINKSSSSSTSLSSKKKRKRDRNDDCEQEKRDISKWLSKKKSSSLDLEEATSTKVSKKSKSSKSSKYSKESAKRKEIPPESTTPTPENFDMPSKEELEEIRNKTKLTQKENEKLKAELNKMQAPPPKEVKNLSLQDMSPNDILDTFSIYKNELDKIYKKYYKKDYIQGHDGINHCFVIRLLNQNIQLKMLEKLTDVYSNTNNTTQATLYANALLPEWIIRVYMEKFNFSRQEAINQVKAQDDYRLHMEEENDGSFIFD